MRKPKINFDSEDIEEYIERVYYNEYKTDKEGRYGQLKDNSKGFEKLNIKNQTYYRKPIQIMNDMEQNLKCKCGGVGLLHRWIDESNKQWAKIVCPHCKMATKAYHSEQNYKYAIRDAEICWKYYQRNYEIIMSLPLKHSPKNALRTAF